MTQKLICLLPTVWLLCAPRFVFDDGTPQPPLAALSLLALLLAASGCALYAAVREKVRKRG